MNSPVTATPVATVTAPRPDGAGGTTGAAGAPRPGAGRGPRGAASPIPMPRDGVWGWLGPLLVAAFAGILRFHRLGVPPSKVFDEVYYAEQARDLLRYGVEFNQADSAPEFVVHPPVGKWVIAVGEWLLGDDAAGWRFSVALLGTLSVLMLARIARRLFRSTLLGCAAGLLLAVDGMHFVHSRTALLDLILMVFALAAFGCLLVDRDRDGDRVRERLRRWRFPGHGGAGGSLGPGFGVRPWRLTAGVFLGLACATKWSGLFFLAVFGLLTVLWDVGARRALGVRRPWAGALLRDAPAAFAAMVLVALVVYVASWAGWFAAGPDTAWGRDWAATRPGPPLVPDALRGLWHYHAEMRQFHLGLDTFHPYKSNPWGWLVLSRPVSFFYEGSARGEAGCDVSQCSQAVSAIGTPVLWFGALAALAVVLFRWAAMRDWRAGAVLAGVAAGYLPWFLFQHRTIYSFYAVAFVPWLVLAVTLVLGMVLGTESASPRRRAVGAGVVGGYVVLAVINFAWLYPVLSAELISYTEWARRMLLPSWI